MNNWNWPTDRQMMVKALHEDETADVMRDLLIERGIDLTLQVEKQTIRFGLGREYQERIWRRVVRRWILDATWIVSIPIAGGLQSLDHVRGFYITKGGRIDLGFVDGEMLDLQVEAGNTYSYGGSITIQSTARGSILF